MEDIIMLKKFAIWFICFGLSFLVQNLGWAEQGKAFLYIHIGLNVLIIALLIAIAIILGLTNGFEFAALSCGVSFISILITAVEIVITLFATWGATKLFNVDFYVAYQIMTFGQCLCKTNNSKNNI